jgi:uracil phosphoribosyltransferase
VEYVRKHLSRQQATLWCGAVDQELTVKSYIVPGIGDVGDLAYGDKM